jgi:hypothetical protein
MMMLDPALLVRWGIGVCIHKSYNDLLIKEAPQSKYRGLFAF